MSKVGGAVFIVTQKPSRSILVNDLDRQYRASSSLTIDGPSFCMSTNDMDWATFQTHLANDMAILNCWDRLCDCGILTQRMRPCELWSK